ncbi:MAG: hypothetical protein NC131_18960 [Roseburia sp.]|nr:hypothetical protein [Roseburia sp.]
MADVGTIGRYWSSAPASSGSASGGFLYFTSANVSPLNSRERATGLTVRCVQHLQLLFLKNNLFLLRQSSFGPEWRDAFQGFRQRGRRFSNPRPKRPVFKKGAFEKPSKPKVRCILQPAEKQP